VEFQEGASKECTLFFFPFRCRTATEYFTFRHRLRSTACLPSAAIVKYNVACAATVFFLLSALIKVIILIIFRPIGQ
jgi:hypothetical protein